MFARSRVYPRRCGEAGRGRSSRCRCTGLSPQVRGSLDICLVDYLTEGSIPAGAGKPTAYSAASVSPGVYPRRCGEASMACWMSRKTRGLSPQVRGSHSERPRPRTQPRSIPAGAGKPPGGYEEAIREQVYPRRCGEAVLGPWGTSAGRGLSPQVRGSRNSMTRLALDDGSIPAGAGKPGWNTSLPFVARVYPRRCGEAPVRPGMLVVSWGLSPQVRGSHAAARVEDARRGSIPAGAGKPVIRGGCVW